MSDKLDRLETRKDTIQVVIESGATHVGGIVGIVVGAVREVTREIGADGHQCSRRTQGPGPIALGASTRSALARSESGVAGRRSARTTNRPGCRRWARACFSLR